MNSRKMYIDISKGIGQFCVIWGHIMMTGITHSFVYSFHMPLFFFLSGYVYNYKKYKTFKQLLYSRIKSLFIPYLVYSCLTWIIWVLYSHALGTDVDNYYKPLLQTILSQGSGGYLVHNTTLWFVTCLLCVQFIYFFIHKIDNKLVRMIICLVLTLCGLFSIMKDSPFRHFLWNLDIALCALPFYAIGVAFRDKKIFDSLTVFVSSRDIRNYLICVGGVAIAFVIQITGAYVNGSISMGYRYLANPILFYLFGLTGTILTVAVSILLQVKFEATKFVRYSSWFGEHSFDVMAIQVPIKGFLIALMSKIMNCNTDYISSNYCYSLLVFIITILFISIFIILKDRFKNHFSNLSA